MIVVVDRDHVQILRLAHCGCESVWSWFVEQQFCVILIQDHLVSECKLHDVSQVKECSQDDAWSVLVNHYARHFRELGCCVMSQRRFLAARDLIVCKPNHSLKVPYFVSCCSQMSKPSYGDSIACCLIGMCLFEMSTCLWKNICCESIAATFLHIVIFICLSKTLWKSQPDHLLPLSNIICRVIFCVRFCPSIVFNHANKHILNLYGLAELVAFSFA